MKKDKEKFYTTAKDYFKDKEINPNDFNSNKVMKLKSKSPTKSPDHDFNNIRTNTKSGKNFNM
jgi:hypothetical protein